MIYPRAHSQLLQIQPFTTSGGRSIGDLITLNLTTNEEALGPSPHVLKVYHELSHKLHRYPDVMAQSLRRALAEHYNIAFDNIICGNGSEEFLYALPRAFCSPGDEVVFSKGSFPVYKIATLAVGAIPIETDPQDFRIDVEAILNAITPRTKLIFIDNPGNPYSTYLRQEEIEQLLENVPPHIAIMLDGAYAEYVTAPNFTAGLEYVEKYPNVIVSRTFSKFYGLAGMRVGWAYGSSAIIDALVRLKAPFNVGTLAQELAIIALQDLEHAEKVKSTNDARRRRLKEELEALGFEAPESQCNFISPRLDASQRIDDLIAFLSHIGICVRSLDSQGFPDRFRFSLSTDADMMLLMGALCEFRKLQEQRIT